MDNGQLDGSTRISLRTARGLSVVAGGAGLFLFLFLSYPLLRGNIYQASDLGAFHFPTRAFYSYCLKEGFSPLWWPDQFCGYYLHGEGQVGTFHPLHWVLYRFLPLPIAFNLEFMTGYLFMYTGMTALLRRWRFPWYAALFGANLFAFSGFTLLHFVHLQAISIIAHLPWLLLATGVLIRTQSPSARSLSFVAIGLLSGSQLLLGYPQYVLFTLMAVGLYVAAHFFEPGVARRIPTLAVAFLLGLAIGAVQVLPTFDIINYAQRQDSATLWQDGSLHPLNFLQWLSPYTFVNGLGVGIPLREYGLFNGFTALLLAVWVVTCWSSLGHRRKLTGLLVFLVLVMVILALGKYGGAYALLAKLPVLGSFRCPARHLVLVHFALAALATLGVTRLTQTDAENKTRALWGFVALTWALAIALWLVQWLASPAALNEVSSDLARLCLGPLLFTGGAGLLQWSKRQPALAVTLLMVVATADITIYAYPHVWLQKPQSTGASDLITALRSELPDDPAFEARTSAYRAHGNWRVARLTLHGLPNYMGYVGLPPAWQLDPNADITKRVAGVRWEKRPLSARDWTVHEDALPLARLVTNAVVSDSPQEAIEEIDVTTTAIVEGSIEISGGLAGTVAWRKNEPGKAALECSAASPQLLVFAQRYHPGWDVEIDGEPSGLLRVNGDFMGCVVPEGEHEVTFTFSPKSLHYGLWVSGIGLLLVAAGWVALGRGRPE
jgi:hypothetical protein